MKNSKRQEKLKKSKKVKKISFPGKTGFGWYNAILIVLLACAVVFSVIDVCCGIISWPESYSDAIDGAAQIITAIICFVGSIIGIAISLQNEEFFGIKITKLYGLRVKKHYCILQIIIISILLCAINLLFYLLGLTIAVLGTLIVAIMFLIKVTCDEIPIMAKDENVLLQILKDRIIYCYIKKEEAPKDLKEAIKYLLYTKTLKEIYVAFKDARDDSYNQYLFMKLLEFQHDLAFDLKEKYDDKEQLQIADSLLENVIDVVLRKFEIPNTDYAEVVKNRYLLTRVLFRIHELDSAHDPLLSRIQSLFHYLMIQSDPWEERSRFLSSIIITLVAKTVKNNDFSIIKGIRNILSTWVHGLESASPALDVFSVLSMHLYYLCYSEEEVPSELKEKIQDFIDEGNSIEGNIRILSWKNIFVEAAQAFEVDYKSFSDFAAKQSHELEYFLYSSDAKWVVWDSFYHATWYLTNLINSNSKFTFDYSAFLEMNPEIREHLKRFGENCLDKDNEFVPTEEMLRIVHFYSDSEEQFILFANHEKNTHAFSQIINSIKVDELKKNTEIAKRVDEIEFAEKIRDSIASTLNNEWGYDPTLPLHNTERYFSVLIEKFVEAVNFRDAIMNFCVSSVVQDIKKTIKKTVLYNGDGFEKGIKRILSMAPQYLTENAKQVIPAFYIKDDKLRDLFVERCNSMETFKSKFLGNLAVVMKAGFRFNYRVNKVEFRKLTEEELGEKVKTYQREDGQYVFNGTFLPKEEIIKIVDDKFTVLTVVLEHQVVSSKDTVFILKPYSKDPAEQGDL